jgi:hemin uptake protein HemP
MRGAPWLHLSSLGIGTYLGDDKPETDALVSFHLSPSQYRTCSSASLVGYQCVILDGHDGEAFLLMLR